MHMLFPSHTHETILLVILLQVISRAASQDRIIATAKYGVPVALIAAAASLAFICFPDAVKNLTSKWSASL